VGVGKQTARQLEALGLRTIGQVAQWPQAQLSRRFGSLGTHIWRLAHGFDDRPVTSHRDRNPSERRRPLRRIRMTPRPCFAP